MEEWRDVVGYEGYFTINEFGEVKSTSRIIKRSTDSKGFYKEGKILNPFISNVGYKRIVLRNGFEQKKYSVHRLVAEAFLPKEEGRDFVNHKDRDRLNNHYSNLEWVSMSENNCHRFDKTKTSSKYYGVSWIKAKKRFVASITVDKKQITIGHFLTEDEAYAARLEYEKKIGVINKYL